MVERKYKVYMHTCIENNKVYIGITRRRLQKRWGYKGSKYKGQRYFWNAINKHGWDNFKHELVLQNLTGEEACAIEKAMIQYYKSFDREHGYNIQRGGISTLEWVKAKKEKEAKPKSKYVATKSTKKLISEHHADVSGKNNPMYGVHPWCYGKGRKIICLEDHKEYTVTEAAQNLNLKDSNIRNVLSKRQKSTGGYHFVYMDEYNVNVKYDMSVGATYNKIVCTDTGVIYNNAKAAGDDLSLDPSSILKVCRGKYKNSKGYHFLFWKEDTVLKRTTRDLVKTTKQIRCMNTNKIYNSIRECARDLGLDPSSITKVCKGKLKNLKGYHFKYVDIN